MKIALVTPASPGSRRGNRVTALRWARLLRQLGHRVTLLENFRAGEWDLAIALHAVRSAASVERAHAAGVPVVVGMAGTDLNVDASRRALELAWRIVVLQPRALEALPPELRKKARPILQSARALPREESDGFEVCVSAHLRDVKDPLRAAEAARLLSASSRVRVTLLGGVLAERWAQAARAEEASNPRFRWLGDRPRLESLRELSRARLLVISSRSEGGANVASEAIAAGVPVIATRIDGTIGLLGEDYPGYFPVGDTPALAALLDRCERDASYYKILQEYCARLRPLVDPVRERRAWRHLLAERHPAALGRFTLRELGAADADELRRDVEAGLAASPRRLACRFFYDDEGSLLFEQICELPEYDLWRNGASLMRAHADELAARFPRDTRIVELGSGSGTNTRILLDAFLRRGSVRYLPIDISRAALEGSARELLADRPRLTITGLAAEYHAGLAAVPRDAGAMLVLFLGSSIGNFHREQAAQFLSSVRERLSRGDGVLLGVDMRKPREVIEPAYDDAQGVTARFNLNLLARINRELGADFDLDGFQHLASYDEAAGRVDMFLVSRRAQRVRLFGREYAFSDGERIHTECSYKYSIDEIAALARAAGLAVEAQWSARDRFTLTLMRA